MKSPEDMELERKMNEAATRAAEAVEGAKAWWQRYPNKKTLLAGAGGVLAATYLASSILAAVNRTPLLPQLFEIVGFGYSVWFWYRYVLFVDGRRELRETLGRLGQRAARGAESLAEKTIEATSSVTSADTPASRRVLEHYAAEHAATREAEARFHHSDDASWVDAGMPSSEAIMQGGSSDSSDTDRSSSTGSGRIPRALFALSWGPGGELAAEGGGWVPTPAEDEEYEAEYLEPSTEWAALLRAAGMLPPALERSTIDAPDDAKLTALAEEAARRAAAASSHPLPPAPPAVAAVESVHHAMEEGDRVKAYVESLMNEMEAARAEVAAAAHDGAAEAEGGSRRGMGAAVFAASVGGGGGGGSSEGEVSESSTEDVGGLDPCLGWDMDACIASGHLKLGQADDDKMASLAAEASKLAATATGFSRHVDQVLHQPLGRGEAPESLDLEGEHGREAGEMERAEMDRLAAQRSKQGSAQQGTTRKPTS